MKKVLFATFTVAVFVLLLNGCGGGGSDEPSVDTQNKPIERLDPTKLNPEFD